MLAARTVLLIMLISVAVEVPAQERKGVGREQGSRQTETQRSGDRRGKSARPPARDEVSRPKKERSRNPEPAVRDSHSAGQQRQAQKQAVVPKVRANHKNVFDTVKQGLMSGRVASLSDLMGPQVYVNLRDGENGYYSAGQAHYVLENYLRTRNIVSLEFTTIGETEATPYATGSAGFNNKGNREVAQVYVSLSQVGEKWVISQIKIY